MDTVAAIVAALCVFTNSVLSGSAEISARCHVGEPVPPSIGIGFSSFSWYSLFMDGIWVFGGRWSLFLMEVMDGPMVFGYVFGGRWPLFLMEVMDGIWVYVFSSFSWYSHDVLLYAIVKYDDDD